MIAVTYSPDHPLVGWATSPRCGCIVKSRARSLRGKGRATMRIRAGMQQHIAAHDRNDVTALRLSPFWSHLVAKET